MAYTPAQPPSDASQLPAYLQREFQKISSEFAAQSPSLRLAPQAALPEKPRDGDTFYFTAGVVSTGSAAGLYQYRSGAWVNVG